MLTNITTNSFDYLGETYHLPINETIKLQSFPRRLFSRARATPSKDSKAYTFYVVTYYDNDALMTTAVFSSNKTYLRKFTDTTKHLAVNNLSKNQCQYLKSLEVQNFREYISIIREEIKTCIENS